jgi:hypothetical protein
VIGLLSVLTVLLVVFHYFTLVKFGALPPAVKQQSVAAFIRVASRSVSLGAADAALEGMIVAAFVCLVLLEVWRRRFSVFLGMVFQTERMTRAVLVVSCLIAVRYYLAPGELSWSADTSPHTAYAWIAARSISQGELPIWTNYFATGSPFLQFYGFLFFYLVGLTDLLFGDIVLSIKLTTAAAHALSGLGMYFLVQFLCKSRGAGFIAGLGYVLSVWHAQQVLFMGRLPLSVFYALLPWPFYFFELMRAQSRKLLHAMGGGIALGLLAFTHPGYGFWAAFFVVAYVAVRLWGERHSADLRRLFLPSSVLVGEGLAFGAYLTLPMWVEQAHTGLRFGVSMSGSPDPTWQQLLIWSNFRFPLYNFHDTHWYGGYLGLTLVILALVGLGCAFLPRLRLSHPRAAAGGVCLVLSLILVFGYRWPVLRSLSVVQAFNSGRYLLFVVFFMSLMVGYGVALIERRWSASPRHGRTCALILLLVGLDLGSTTFQHPYLSEEPKLFPLETRDGLRQAASKLPEDQMPAFRVFYGTGSVYRLLVVSWLPVKMGFPSFLSAYNEAPVAMATIARPMEQLLNPVLERTEDPRDLNSVEGFDRLARGLCLLDTKYLFAVPPSRDDFFSWALPTLTPAVVSPRISGWEMPVSDDPETARKGLMDLLPES